jgi:hypothetical protein
MRSSTSCSTIARSNSEGDAARGGGVLDGSHLHRRCTRSSSHAIAFSRDPSSSCGPWPTAVGSQSRTCQPTARFVNSRSTSSSLQDDQQGLGGVVGRHDVGSPHHQRLVGVVGLAVASAVELLWMPSHQEGLSVVEMQGRLRDRPAGDIARIGIRAHASQVRSEHS